MWVNTASSKPQRRGPCARKHTGCTFSGHDVTAMPGASCTPGCWLPGWVHGAHLPAGNPGSSASIGWCVQCQEQIAGPHLWGVPVVGAPMVQVKAYLAVESLSFSADLGPNGDPRPSRWASSSTGRSCPQTDAFDLTSRPSQGMAGLPSAKA